jgi:hypothetical protein
LWRFFQFRGKSVNLIACVTLALVSLAFSLFVAEGIVRLLTKYELIDSLKPFGQYMNYSDRRYNLKNNAIFRRSDDPDLGWEAIPGIHRDGAIRINSAGFRGPEYALTAPPGKKRLAFIGDSETFGELMPETDTITAKLQGELDRRALSYEVLNFGVVGYNSEQEWALLRKKVIDYHPDAVVVYYVFNDPELPQRTLFFQGSGLLRNSYLYNLYLWYRVSQIDKGHAEVRFDGYVKYYHNLHNSKYFERVEDIIRKMGDYCGSRGIRFILLIAPEVYQIPDLSENYPYYNIHAKLKRLTSDTIEVVDPLPELAKAWDPSNPKTLWSREYDPHKNGKASEAISRALASML